MLKVHADFQVGNSGTAQRLTSADGRARGRPASDPLEFFSAPAVTHFIAPRRILGKSGAPRFRAKLPARFATG
ncbi:MAG TPA: hypothetical protein VEQ59_00850, partial [Polyangiaceae bacterium]|nr:hypothetical protein [Polyangiaceae bacterium]